MSMSLQVFRALRPTLSSKACTALMAGLAKCLANPSKLSLEVAADVVLTLQVCSPLAQQQRRSALAVLHKVC